MKRSLRCSSSTYSTSTTSSSRLELNFILSFQYLAVFVQAGLGRENVGMSNHNPNEKLEPRKSKVSVALAINHGLGGPKAMAKAAVDGQLVNIPARPNVYNQATKKINLHGLLVFYSWREV